MVDNIRTFPRGPASSSSSPFDYSYHYTKFPNLAAYINRVGAEQKNFRRFVVTERDGSGYPREKAVIRITPDREVTSSEKEYEPTDEEAAAIKAELEKVEWPVSVKVHPRMVDELRASGMLNDKGTLYVVYDLSRTNVIMCQERIDPELRPGQDDGQDKLYLPWTPFQAVNQSVRWLQMEPDGPLPFWKPSKKRAKANIMVHEGAKAAAFCDDLVNNPERRDELRAHPFGQELARYEHWGALGGARGTHRCDYEELRAGAEADHVVSSVVYVCDNDPPGEEALSTFSRMWSRELRCVTFGKRFPHSFDLADEVPEAALYDDTKRARLTLADLTRPATWATRIVGKSGRTVIYDLTDDFAKEWAHSVEPEMFINMSQPRVMYPKSEFEHYVAAFAHAKVSVSELLMRRAYGRVETVKYEPGLSSGVHPSADKTFFNVHCRPRFEKFDTAPDVGPWLDYLSVVFPGASDRREVSRWVATLIARPGVKMQYGLLLISNTHGVGKNTLGNVLTTILGVWNVSTPTEKNIIDDTWTYWQQNELAVVSEIYAGHSIKAYNNLKEIITEKTLDIKKKYLAPYKINNHLHMIACSNSIKALKLDNTDRRWLVPKVTEKKQPKSYWVGLYDWLDHDGGYRKVWHWAYDYLESEQPVADGDEAPWTSAKQGVIKESYGDDEEFIDEYFAAIKELADARGELSAINPKFAVSSEIQQAAEWIKSGVPFGMWDKDAMVAIRWHASTETAGRKKSEASLSDIRKVAQNAGFHCGEERNENSSTWGVRNARFISLSEELATTPLRELRLGEAKMVDLNIMVREVETGVVNKERNSLAKK